MEPSEAMKTANGFRAFGTLPSFTASRKTVQALAVAVLMAVDLQPVWGDVTQAFRPGVRGLDGWPFAWMALPLMALTMAGQLHGKGLLKPVRERGASLSREASEIIRINTSLQMECLNHSQQPINFNKQTSTLVRAITNYNSQNSNNASSD